MALLAHPGAWGMKDCGSARSENIGVTNNGNSRWLPSFFVIGPPRTGTSWLHEVLSTRVYLPNPTKETRFFDTHFWRGLAWYYGHFRANDIRQVGEVAPTYFSCDDARERIARLVPSAKIVCIFRDPVDRVFSLYRLKRAYGMIPWSFEEALEKDPELMESGKYATYLKKWLRTFGRSQILATVFDDLREQPQAYVDRFAEFTGIDRFQLGESELKKIHSSEMMTHPRNYRRTRSATLLADWLKARQLDSVVALARKSSLVKYLVGGGRPFARPAPELSAWLYEYFRPEVEALEDLLGRDFSAWKQGRGLIDSKPLHRKRVVAL